MFFSHIDSSELKNLVIDLLFIVSMVPSQRDDPFFLKNEMDNIHLSKQSFIIQRINLSHINFIKKTSIILNKSDFFENRIKEISETIPYKGNNILGNALPILALSLISKKANVSNDEKTLYKDGIFHFILSSTYEEGLRIRSVKDIDIYSYLSQVHNENLRDKTTSLDFIINQILIDTINFIFNEKYKNLKLNNLQSKAILTIIIMSLIQEQNCNEQSIPVLKRITKELNVDYGYIEDLIPVCINYLNLNNTIEQIINE